MECHRCASYAIRLDELNRNFNQLWDGLTAAGIDPEHIRSQSMITKERGISLIIAGALGLSIVAGNAVTPVLGLLVLSVELIAGGIAFLVASRG